MGSVPIVTDPRTVGAALVAALLLSGCAGGGGADTAAPTSAPASAATTDTAQQDQQDQQGEDKTYPELQLDDRLEPIPAGLIGLTIYASAYFSEIFRAGFEAVPRGHVEAAQCVGLSRGQILRRILLPEMTMLVLPQCVNMAIILIKETAILSIITVPEMTGVISAIGSQQYAFVEAMFLLAIFYWVLVETCGYLGRLAEARLSKFRFAVP